MSVHWLHCAPSVIFMGVRGLPSFWASAADLLGSLGSLALRMFTAAAGNQGHTGYYHIQDGPRSASVASSHGVHRANKRF
jgi:hypothetical protein